MHRQIVICLACAVILTGFLLAQTTSSNPSQGSPSAASSDSKQVPVDQGTTERETQQLATPSQKELHDAKYHLQLGTVTVGVDYLLSSRGAYPYYPAVFWDPFWVPYPLFAYPGYLPDLAYGGRKGEIRLSAYPKKSEVYIDGAYAGTADHLKNIWLEPGAYDLAVLSAGRESFHQRIYILGGKSLKIRANLPSRTAPEGKEEKP